LAHHTENAAEAPSLAESASQLRVAISDSRTNTDHWWHTVIGLAGLVADPEHLLSWDLTSTPLWSNLVKEEQEELLQLGLDYVNNREPEVSRWAGQNQLTVDDVMPDWAAVFLLRRSPRTAWRCSSMSNRPYGLRGRRRSS
jgi:hypothetical protein